MTYPLHISLASWNILHTTYIQSQSIPPQIERLSSFLAGLKAPDVPFDVLGLYEVQGTSTQHGGLLLAKDLKLPKQGFSAHGCEDEGIFMATKQSFTTPKRLVMDPEHRSRTALLTTSKGVSVAATHPSHHPFRTDWRMRQFRALIDQQSDHEHAVIMGDLNCLAWQKPRRLLEAHGYKSVLGQLGMLGQSTFPAHYRTADGTGLPFGIKQITELAVNHFGYSIDDIYVKGDHKVINGGFLEGKSDHLGVWATIAFI